MATTFKNLVHLFESSAAKFGPNQLFGTVTDGNWAWQTYDETRVQVDQCRAGLAKLGVTSGDKVAVIADNRVEWAVGAYATYGLRAAYIPMYEAQKPAEWQFIIEDSGSKVVFCAKRSIYEKVKAFQPNVACLHHVICFEGDDDDSFKALLASGAADPVPSEQPERSETAGFIYTSGTTGQPKGVILSHGNLCSNVEALQLILPLLEEDRTLSFLPWAHSFGQTVELHGMVSMGASMGINDEVPHLIDNLGVVKPSVLFAVPRIFNRIYDGVNLQMKAKPGIIQKLFHSGVGIATRKNAGGSIGLVDSLVLKLADKLIFTKVRGRFGGRLRYAVSGSAALNADVARFIDALGIEVFEGYGLTETSPIATTNYPGNRKIGSVGKPIDQVRIVIDKEITGDAVNGEIIVYGPNVMQGYHNRDDETAKVIMDDAGFRTGDMGRLDEDGYLYITGRIKEQYKLENGKYVVPSPLEEDLKLSPYIGQAMLYGANHPHNVALVVPDMATFKPWLKEHNISVEDAPNHPDVKALFMAEMSANAKSFKGYEKPKDVVVTLDEFTTDNDMLTPTLKLKRRKVLEVYQESLEALF